VIAALIGLGYYQFERGAVTPTPIPTATPTPIPTATPTPTLDVEMHAAATHVLGAIDNIKAQIGGSSGFSDRATMVVTFVNFKVTADAEANWIEQQPLRIQGQSLIAQAHGYLRQFASDSETCVLAATGGWTSAGTLCSNAITEFALWFVASDLYPSLRQLADG
jgi:hypothetical protein